MPFLDYLFPKNSKQNLVRCIKRKKKKAHYVPKNLRNESGWMKNRSAIQVKV